MKNIIFWLVLLTSSITLAGPREIKIVVPYSAGGPTDKVVRMLCTELSNNDYTFVTEYKLGAGGSIAAAYVAKSTDTTFMVTSNGLIGAPIIDKTFTYSLEDFILVDYLGTEPLILVTSQQSNISNIREFIKKSKTQFMPYGSAGVGTSGHITGAIVANNNKNLQHIPYKGSAAALTDLLAGNITWAVDSDLNLKSFIADKKLKPLAVYFYKRLPQYPTVPTVKEVGIDDKNFYRWHIIVANNNADSDVVKYVKDRTASIAIRKKIEELGIDSKRSKHTTNFFDSESEKMLRIVTDYNIN